jgi:hypothetical protein
MLTVKMVYLLEESGAEMKKASSKPWLYSVG